MSTLKDRVKGCRAQFRWTQQDLADKAGVNLDTIRRTEQRQFEPRLGTIRRLADALSVREGWLAFGEGEMVDLRHMTVDEQHRLQSGYVDQPGYVVSESGPWIEDGDDWRVDQSAVASRKGGRRR